MNFQLQDEIITFMMAGHETTANALTWTWYLLSKHPEYEQRMFKELESVLDGKTPQVEDLKKLSLTYAILQESMRLFPSTWILQRKAIADDKIGGYHIPAGSYITISQYVTHRHPAFWTDPDEFRPERFLDEQTNNERPAYAYFPFGGGPRKCIGYHFAMIEAQLVMVLIAQKYRLQLANLQPIGPEPLITLRTKKPMLVYLQKRESKKMLSSAA